MRALVHYDLDDPSLARIDALSALALDPGDSVAHYADGRVAADGGNLEHAVTAFTSALEFKADFADALVRRADVLALLGHTREAIRDYQAVILLEGSSETGREASASLRELQN